MGEVTERDGNLHPVSSNVHRDGPPAVDPEREAHDHLGFGVEGCGFMVEGLWCMSVEYGLGIMVYDVWFSVQGLWFKV